MKDSILLVLILIGSMPVAYFILRAIFGKSIILIVSLWSVLLVYICCEMFYIVGKYGLPHVAWALPVAFAVGTAIFMYLGKILKKPLQKNVESLALLAKGNLSIQVEKDEINSRYELAQMTETILLLKTNLPTLWPKFRKNPADYCT